ncbi:hypothetical protein BDV95DRAFT_153352 [Massariosphaeria phaeospora]|uniref:Amino-acid acetyltransferase, mitochondrial n=1 Tax=Massariosphaeria phaeospora TaxID=100035 RepID=A0A7C8IHX4_9PLEO|nr:hypothetical protein BDV95DRAFT_153352 [Massariosphaeria phaeospora]
MSLCRKAPSRGMGRAAVNLLPRNVSIPTACNLPSSLPFSTCSRLCVSGIEPARNGKKSSAKERQRAERTQLTRLLKESPGNRDARNFLKHFDSPTKPEAPAESPKVEHPKSEVVARAHHNEWRLTRTGVNLGNLYEPTKAVQNSPVFTREVLESPIQDKSSIEPLHLALVKLRQPQILDDETLGGIALTLSQMARLGLNLAVVVDCDEDAGPDTLEIDASWEAEVRDQAARIIEALEEYNEPGAFEVDHALCYANVGREVPSTVEVRGRVEVQEHHLLFPPIEDGIIPVIPPFAYDSEFRKVRVRADEVVLALTREFAGITTQISKGDQSHGLLGIPVSNKSLLDRVIILDPLGGIPSNIREDGAHVFINLEAEYQDVKSDLERSSSSPSKAQHTRPQLAIRHVKNLALAQRALKLLPPSSSAIIITPAEAAISSQAQFLSTPSTGVRTRRSKNPLIHNLLTDKPMTSSSLPAPLSTRPSASAAPNAATFLKRGIPVTIIPDPRTTGPWQPPSPSHPCIELADDPRIDFPRLVDLIEDSFRRKIDARHYLERIRGRVAGIIIAGNYEGGAICTWEAPPSLSEPPPPDSPLWIPYLDKFAVLTKSQGSGGVADIVWNALTRTCFPQGVVWRSRTSNPVNKWYFERSLGMWNLPDEQWTMFWTSEGVVEEWARKRGAGTSGNGAEMEMSRWDAYVDVCGGVVPSWADGKRPD